MIFAIIFWFSVLAIVHSYVLFPLLLNILSRGKTDNTIVYTAQDNLPHLYLLMAVYNEEVVLRKKIESIYHTSYPKDKIQVYIGSDASTDGTVAILNEYKERFPEFNPVIYRERMGKIRIINHLFDVIRNEAENAILVMTDANVFFQEDTLFNLTRHFKNPEIGLTGANVLNIETRSDGISFQEKSYVNRENRIKYLEGLIWGTMMGAFGACYALRSNLFRPVPGDFKVDDFYITISVLEQNKKAVSILDSTCYEDVSNEVKEEFRRKVRIAGGNFQNLRRFKSLLWPPFTGLAFSFFSHKVLRWLGPFFILFAYLSNIWLIHLNKFYWFTFIIQSVFLLSPLFDAALKRLNIHSVLLRFIAYFYYMNLAMLVGLIKFLKGGIDNVWQPTKRNQ